MGHPNASAAIDDADTITIAEGFAFGVLLDDGFGLAVVKADGELDALFVADLLLSGPACCCTHGGACDGPYGAA